MTSPTYAPAEIPTTVRDRKPNPHAEIVGQLAKDGKAASFTLADTSKDSDVVKAQLRLLSLAGGPVGKTVRKLVTQEGPNVKITFWTTDKIQHNATPAPAPASA